MSNELKNLKKANILYRWGLTAEELTSIIDENPSMRGLMLGYVAEYKLRRLFFEDARIKNLIKEDDHNRKSKGDLRFEYRGRDFRVECKSLQTNSIKSTPDGFKATFQCDASDRRTVIFSDGTKCETTCLRVGEFDLLVVNLFALTEEWRFAFALNGDLPRSQYKKYTKHQRRELLSSSVAITWPLNPPFVEDPFVLLDRVIDGA